MYRPELTAVAIYEMLRDAPAVRELNVEGRNLVLMNYVNTSPDNTPWIGVYMGPTEFSPYTAGSRSGGANTLRAQPQFKVIVQAGGVNEEPSEIVKRLGEIVGAVLDTIWLDTTLKGTVKTVTKTSLELSYYGEDSKAEASVEFPMADITVTAEVRT